MMDNLLNSREKHMERLSRLARVFARADRTLCGRPITVTTQNVGPGGPPAWSIENRIMFNSARVTSLDTLEDIVVANGLNYHELAHVMYTPGNYSSLQTKINDYCHGKRAHVVAMIRMAFNILEDQRIETLFTQRYRASAPYFEMTFMRYCLAADSNIQYAFPLAWGRRYLSREVRAELARVYADQSKVRTIKRLIDQYRLLTFTGDTAIESLAVDIIEKFAKAITPDAERADPFGHMSSNEPMVGSGEPTLDGDQQERDAEKAAKETEKQDRKEAAEERRRKREEEREQEEQEEGDEQGDGDGADGASGESDDTDTEDGEGGDGGIDGEGEEGDSSDGQGDGDGDAESEDQGEGEASSGGGAGTGVQGYDPHGKVKAVLAEAMEEVMHDADVIRDAGRDLEVIKVSDGIGQRKAQSLGFNRKNNTDPIQINVARKIGREFTTLVADSDPGFHKHRSSGRLNIQRAMMGAELDVAFDQWQEGKNDASDVDVFIAADVSYSMVAVIDQLSFAVWAIKAGVESIRHDIVVPVYTFHNVSYRIHEYDSRAQMDKMIMFRADGNTNPSVALSDAVYHFAASKRTHKILFIVTDGVWDSHDHDRKIKALRDAGVIVVVAYLSEQQVASSNVSRLSEIFGHGASVFGAIDKSHMGDLVTLAKNVVIHTMKN